jgi:hypothetical protein
MSGTKCCAGDKCKSTKKDHEEWTPPGGEPTAAGAADGGGSNKPGFKEPAKEAGRYDRCVYYARGPLTDGGWRCPDSHKYSTGLNHDKGPAKYAFYQCATTPWCRDNLNKMVLAEPGDMALKQINQVGDCTFYNRSKLADGSWKCPLSAPVSTGLNYGDEPWHLHQCAKTFTCKNDLLAKVKGERDSRTNTQCPEKTDIHGGGSCFYDKHMDNDNWKRCFDYVGTHKCV